MKKVLFFCAVATMAFLSSCKKDKTLENPSNAKASPLTQKSTLAKGGIQLTEAEIQAITEGQKKAFLAKYKPGNEQAKAGGCPMITEIHPFITGDDYACQNPGGVTVQFSVTVFEYGSYNYTRSFYEDLGGLNIDATIISETTTLLCPDWNPNQQGGECPRMIIYKVSCLTPFWGDIDEINFNTLTTCHSAHGNPPPPPLLNTQMVSLWTCGSPAACEAIYTSNPPLVVISPLGIPGSPTPGTYQVNTNCNQGVICYEPYVLCPYTITMEIRMIAPSVGPWTASPGYGFGGVPSGTYEYRNCVFHYDTQYQSPFTGSSLPSGTGTFTVF